MFVPRHRVGFHIPGWLAPLTLTGMAVVATILGWAAFAARPTSSGVDAMLPAAAAGDLDSVAYTVREGGLDNIYLRPIGVLGEPRLIASFRPSWPSPALHLRGAASPAGDRIAVLALEQPVATAQLTFVGLPGGEQRRAEGEFRQLSELVWTRDGTRVAAVLASGREVVEVHSETLETRTVATFAGARNVVPVGYSAMGDRLFVVVIDQGGSALWAVAPGRATRVAELSAGLTTSWTLSPDGSRLAFVDIVGVGEQRYAGRTAMIATGEVLSASPQGDQVGAAWRPGAELAQFGGPGGSFGLTPEAAAGAAQVVPLRWSPDARWLVAAIYPAADAAGGEASSEVELVMPGQPIRVPLGDAGSTTFIGFVNDLD